MRTRITELFGIEFPIVQAGMVYCSGSKLAAAAANVGALGLLGAGSMRPEVLRSQLRKAKALSDRPIGVNLPLFYKHAEACAQVMIDEGVRVAFTSAGSPKTHTARFQAAGMKVVHVVATAEQAKKCELAGVDAVVAEGFEAGGHNGPAELTTMVLVRLVRQATSLPLLAAGGIADGAAMAAAFALGADGVQVGSRFAVTKESSAHEAFVQAVLAADEQSTRLMLKQLAPVRLLKNPFYEAVLQAETECAGPDALRQLLGSGRARRGMLEGDLVEGELEIGQVAALIKDLPSAAEVVQRLMAQYHEAVAGMPR